MAEKKAPSQGPVTRRDMLVSASTVGAALAAAGAVRGALAAGETEAAGFQLNDLRQIAFVVKDIEVAAKRFAALFGAKVPNVITTDPVEQAHTVYRGKPTPARAKLAFFRFGSMAIELIEPIGGPSTWREALEKNGEGIHHIAFHVADMKQALAALNKLGFETIQTGDFTGGFYAYVDTTPALCTVVELLASA